MIGALLMLLGIAWLLQRTGAVDLSWETILSALLVVLGVGMVLTARRRGGGGLVIVGVLLAIALTATSSLDVAILRSGVGNRAVVASTLPQARRVTSLFVGELVVDLRDLELAPTAADAGAVVADGAASPTRLAYRLGVGDLQLVLPPADAVAVHVETSVRMGQIAMLGQEENGSNVEVQFEDRDYEKTPLPQLVVHLDIGIGKVTITRGVSSLG